MIDTELAWAAGFFDGEGHVRYRKDRGLQIGIGQTAIEPLNRFSKAVDLPGSVYFYDRSSHPTHKDFYLLQYTGPQALKVMKSLVSYLSGPKTSQYRLAKMQLELRQQELQEQRRYCKRGHLLEGSNLYTYPSGKRMCRTCHKGV